MSSKKSHLKKESLQNLVYKNKNPQSSDFQAKDKRKTSPVTWKPTFFHCNWVKFPKRCVCDSWTISDLEFLGMGSCERIKTLRKIKVILPRANCSVLLQGLAVLLHVLSRRTLNQAVSDKSSHFSDLSTSFYCKAQNTFRGRLRGAFGVHLCNWPAGVGLSGGYHCGSHAGLDCSCYSSMTSYFSTYLLLNAWCGLFCHCF